MCSPMTSILLSENAKQRKRLREIADKCPVHRTLEGGAAVKTDPGEAIPDDVAEKPGQRS